MLYMLHMLRHTRRYFTHFDAFAILRLLRFHGFIFTLPLLLLRHCRYVYIARCLLLPAFHKYRYVLLP